MRSEGFLFILDLDDTLVDTSGCLGRVKLRDALQAMVSAGLVVDSFENAYALLLEVNDKARNIQEALQLFLAGFGSSAGILEVGLNAYSSGYETLHVTALPYALETLEFLRTKGEVVLVSAGKKEEQEAKMQKAGISKRFFRTLVFVKDYDKKKKYEEVMQEMGYPVSKVIVCGDKFSTDLLPAQELGAVTVHMMYGRGLVDRSFQGKEPDYRITSLQELRDIVEGLSLA